MAEMTLAGFRVVHEVAGQGSFSAAAISLGYTQSAVSRQVAAMEHAAGTALFERLPRGVRPTAAGEVLVRRAARILGEVDGALEEVSGVRDRLAGRMVVAGFPTAAAVLLPRAIALLGQRHPDLQVELQEAASPVQLRRLRAGRIEVALLATGDVVPERDLVGLRHEVVVIPRGPGIAVAVGHRLADREFATVADLADETWIVGTGPAGEPQFGPWPGLDRPRIGYAVRNWPTRFGLVAAGLGITRVPGLAADSVPAGVRWLPVRDPAVSGSLEVATAESRSAAAQAVVRAVHSVASRMV
ncbi:MAG TPA: LysR family transcriptional regulator [Pseudonocardia sp.]|jgi:DNA-binding transcriptional LysR family regulator|uniref:LysR family transcriptional regulator n=1 Tax=Pseudonocardia sp. TaxID=60912 RepID=UPI002B4ACB53|nr:LysR family transcriptional regulator [Pseudonocardia sp.]HLU58966.1 LysR family transcriptional regulator [Pseudonocardia sp.]